MADARKLTLPLLIAIALLGVSAFMQIVHAQDAAGNADAQATVPSAEATATEDVQTNTQSDTTQSQPAITFPIAELGNCADKTSCKAYCDVAAHIDACVTFAQAHGLMNHGEAVAAHTFAKTLKQGGGPGGCTDPKSCKAYCDNTAHLQECIAFAQKTGANDQGLQQGLKIAAYLKSGGTLPGNCDSPDSCHAYCSTLTHIAECQAFAKAAGITVPEQQGNDQLAQKLQELATSGRTPGGCTSKDACEAYCSDKTHAEECLNFAQQLGVVSSDQAEKVRTVLQSGGPGGCTLPDECRAFCSNPDNQSTCFQFAQRQGLITQDQAQQFVQARQQIQQFSDQDGTQNGTGGDQHTGSDVGGPNGQMGQIDIQGNGQGPQQGQNQSFFGRVLRPMQGFFTGQQNSQGSQPGEMMQGGPNQPPMTGPYQSEQGIAGQNNAPNMPETGQGNGPPLGSCVHEKLQGVTGSGQQPDDAIIKAAILSCQQQYGNYTGQSDNTSNTPPMPRPAVIPRTGTGTTGMQGIMQGQTQEGMQTGMPATMPPRPRVQGSGSIPTSPFDESGVQQTGPGIMQGGMQGSTGGMMPPAQGMMPPSGMNTGGMSPPPPSGTMNGTSYYNYGNYGGSEGTMQNTSTMPPPPVGSMNNNTSPMPPPPPPTGTNSTGTQPPPTGTQPQSVAPFNLMVADVFQAIISLYGFR